MPINANTAPGGGPTIEPMEPGTYPARVVQVVDLGLQPQSYQGQEKPPAREVMLTYEFVDEFLKDEEGQDMGDKPRWLSERFALFNLGSERAKSTQRYNALDPNGIYEGDFTQLVDVPCNVTVVHNPNKKNPARPWENIAAVTTMRTKDAEKCRPLVNAWRVFDLEDPDLEVFLALPNWVKDKVKSNLEFEGSELKRLLKNGQPEKAAESVALEDVEDENPF